MERNRGIRKVNRGLLADHFSREGVASEMKTWDSHNSGCFVMRVLHLRMIVMQGICRKCTFSPIPNTFSTFFMTTSGETTATRSV